MKRAWIVAVGLILASPAQAQIQQDKTYTLSLTGADIATIATLLNEAPYKMAQPIIAKIIEQTRPAPTGVSGGEPSAGAITIPSPPGLPPK